MYALRKVANILGMSLILTLLIGLSGTRADAAIVGPWNLSGPGTTSVDVDGNSTLFTYALDPAGFATQTWTATANVVESGLYQFDWTYSGLHAFFNVTAFLNTINPNQSLVDAGPAFCCTSPSSGFSFAGSEAFLVTAGQTIGFSFGGSNSDSNNSLIGTVEISAVPLPPAFLMLLVALGLTGFIAHRGGSPGY